MDLWSGLAVAERHLENIREDHVGSRAMFEEYEARMGTCV